VRAYLDSCTVIYLIEGPESLSRSLRSALDPSKSSPKACISELTRLECRVGPIRQGNPDLLSEFDAFFGSREVEIIPHDRDIFELATQIRATHGTKTPDALHLATAIAGQCAEFWTNDSRLAAAARGRIEIRIIG
jgi:predicted nucleic acid-binding protein